MKLLWEFDGNIKYDNDSVVEETELRFCWCRGLPIWLHDIPGIVFRSDNEQFKVFHSSF